MLTPKADTAVEGGGGGDIGGGATPCKGGSTIPVFVLSVVVAHSVVEAMALALTLLVQVRGPRQSYAVDPSLVMGLSPK